MCILGHTYHIHYALLNLKIQRKHHLLHPYHVSSTSGNQSEQIKIRWANRLTSLQRKHTVKDFPFPFYQGEWPSSWQHCNAIETKQLWSCQHIQLHILHMLMSAFLRITWSPTMPKQLTLSFVCKHNKISTSFCCDWLVCQKQKRKKACKMHSIT